MTILAMGGDLLRWRNGRRGGGFRQERGRSIFCLRRRELASTSFSRCLKWGTSGRARTADGGGYMTIRHDYRFARASWRALAAALAAASLTLPALAQEAAP